MPKLIDGADADKVYATRSKTTPNNSISRPQNRFAKSPNLTDKMAGKEYAGKNTFNLSQIELEESDKIITEKQRKDPGAVVDALNQIHFLVRNNQRALDSQRNTFEDRFSQLNERIDNLNRNVDTAHQKLTDHGKDICALKSGKAEKSELKSLEKTVSQLKVSYDNRFETSEKQHTSLLIIIKEQSNCNKKPGA